MRWIGIDEAGYGPNLGPMVLAAVVAEGPGPDRPDLWRDREEFVCRAGGRGGRLWIDDSKRLYKQGVGIDRLEAAALAALDAAGLPSPTSTVSLLAALGTNAERSELLSWLPEGSDPPLPSPGSAIRVEAALKARPLLGAPWRLAAIRAEVVGPARFNRGLIASGSKAKVHFDAFATLLRWAWELAGDGAPTLVRSDKHGGRHFYTELLRDALPSSAIVAGPEGPELSRYELTDGDRCLSLELLPRADGDDGLVALASILAKLVRERWMLAFNAYWASRVPGLRPTAGYPVDACRFRREVLAHRPDPDPPLDRWWRAK
ncbi:ribonuclease H family protein [Tautonia sociabilis]|uniref:Uncharacterized protein n=1 Tax=Tautonia sociabilis TaxID=2080755 RepID=A0A432MJN1_9BACT|nr:hypothetical protein [Tautonia sociabilis]RUL87460.1 hypothetical protein TsocGM_12325 [Tautonia sociabilis]